jgi:uncharacterized coiled-coil DUF342 family protein
VERPDKVAHEKELDDLSNEIKAIQDERQKVQDTIDGKMNSGKGSEVSIERDALGKLRAQKGALIDEKKKLVAKLDAIKNQGDKIAKDRKDTRASVKLSTVEEIDQEIARLKKTQETTSMSLSDEKKILKEIDQLQKSKALVATLKSKENDLEDVKAQRKLVAAQITAKDKEIDVVQAEITLKMDRIKEITDRETDKRDVLKELFTKRDDLRKQINDIFKKKDAARAVFRDKSNDWYNYQRALAAKKKMEYEAEKKLRDEQHAAWLKAKEEEEAKKIPYEEEQNLCDFLADYLTRTYLVDKEAEAKKAAEEAEKQKSADVVAVAENPFAKFKPVQKQDDVEYFGKGKGKKKRDRTKKKEEKLTSGPLTLNMDSFEQFAFVGLTPPTNIDQVAKTVEDLKARKIWYSEQPRGSVPTATEIRKANEKAAAKLRNSNLENGAVAEPVKAKAKPDNFSLSNDEFVQLGSGVGASALNASWGQKPVAEEPPVPEESADTTPTEE